MRPSEPTAAEIAERLGAVQQRLDQLAGHHVEIIAVTKAFPGEVLTAAVEAGCTAIGENYAQELAAKLPLLEPLGERRPRVHFVGHVQSNKVRSLAGAVDVWQTLDRTSLADAIARRDPGSTVMVQVNTTGESSKSGCEPADTEALVAHAVERGLDVTGLMTIGPTDVDEVETRRVFRELRRLADELGLASCSMGMSADHEIAAQEGSTHVRLGTVLFGPRPRAR